MGMGHFNKGNWHKAFINANGINGQAQGSIFSINLGRVPQLKPKTKVSMGKPKAPSSAPTWAGCLNLSSKPKSPWANPRLHLHHQLASPLGYHPQRKLPPPAAPWRGEQQQQPGGIQKTLPPSMMTGTAAHLAGAGQGEPCLCRGRIH